MAFDNNLSGVFTKNLDLFENATLTPNSTVGMESQHSMVDFYIGLALAVSSSLFIGTSYIIKKKALLRLAAKDVARRAGQGGYGYLKEWMWWAGVLTMGFGEACNFTAYAFAPASLVTPLGALSVLVSTILSSRLLNERLNLLGKIGCAICILGSTVVVIHSPKEENITSMQELGFRMQDPVFILYVLFVVVASVVLIFYVAPKYGQSNILVFISICSLIGSLSVLGCKGLGLAITETLAGQNQFNNGLTYLWLFSIIFCVSMQLNYLNKALDIFNTAIVTPIYYVFFTAFVIIASGILYDEWSKLVFLDILGNLTGLTVTIIGVFQMQLFKDFNVNLAQMRHMIWRSKGEAIDDERIEWELLGKDRPRINSSTALVQHNGKLNSSRMYDPACLNDVWSQQSHEDYSSDPDTRCVHSNPNRNPLLFS